MDLDHEITIANCIECGNRTWISENKGYKEGCEKCKSYRYGIQVYSIKTFLDYILSDINAIERFGLKFDYTNCTIYYCDCGERTIEIVSKNIGDKKCSCGKKLEDAQKENIWFMDFVKRTFESCDILRSYLKEKEEI